MKSPTTSGGRGCTDRDLMMRACACDARWSSATVRMAILSRRAWRVVKGEMIVAAGFDDGCSMDTTVVSSPSLLVSLKLVLSPRLLARSALGLLLSVPVDALVSINGTGVVCAGEGGGGGGDSWGCGGGDDDGEGGVFGWVVVVHGVVEGDVVETGVEFACILKLATPPPRDVISPRGGTMDVISFVHRRGVCIAARGKKGGELLQESQPPLVCKTVYVCV